MATTTPNPSCPDCGTTMRSHGRRADGRRRFKCFPCKRVHTEARQHLFGGMKISEESALTALSLLCEGSSVRAVSRVVGLHKATILRLLRWAGEQCERFMERTVKDVPVSDVQCDEIWSFIYCKEKSKHRIKSTDPRQGDSYCFVALERDSKLVLTWHLGRRTNQHADRFAEKLDKATSGRFQLSTDAFEGYVDSLGYHVGGRSDYGTISKEFGYTLEEQRRYSPPRLIGSEKKKVHGEPDMARVCTSHIERGNLTIRTNLRRFTRLTIAFSKCWENHKAALALFFAWYNFCKMHRTIKMTPAMKADLARKPWSMRELIAAAVA